jgi:hypothetical protein
MKHLWKDLLGYGLPLLIILIGATWAIATDQWPSQWTWGTAALVVGVVALSSGICVAIITSKVIGRWLYVDYYWED